MSGGRGGLAASSTGGSSPPPPLSGILRSRGSIGHGTTTTTTTTTMAGSTTTQQQQQQQQKQQQQGGTANNNNNNSISSGSSSSGGLSISIWDRVCFFLWCFCCCGCFGGSEHDRNRRHSELIYRLEQTMKSRLYRFFSFCFTMMLLFGAVIRNLWAPPESDHVFDILFMMTFGFFILDMVLRMCVNRNYFALDCFSRQNNKMGGGGTRCRFGVGNFLFWCDLISLLSVLFEISWSNPSHFGIRRTDITLNSLGMPTYNDLNYYFSYEYPYELRLFVTISKTSRIERLVRSSKISTMSSKINWYWFLQNCSVTGLQRNWKAFLDSRMIHSSSSGAGASAGAATGGGRRDSATLLLSSAENAAKAAAEAAQSPSNRKNRKGNSNNNNNNNKRNKRSLPMIVTKCRGLLESLGILSREDEEFRRQLAVTKIQRAWRAELKSRRTVEHSERQSGSDTNEYYNNNRSWRRRSSSNNNYNSHSMNSHGHGSPFDRSSFRGGGTGRPSMQRYNSTRTDASHNNSVMGANLDNNAMKGRYEGRSHVGSAMRELTGTRVAMGIIIALTLTVFLTYSESNASRAATMIVLHAQTQFPAFANASLHNAIDTSTPDLFFYEYADGTNQTFVLENGENSTRLRDRETRQITVTDHQNRTTSGKFAFRSELRSQAWTDLFATIFILLVWLYGIRAFVGPVMILVVMPIERMVRILGMMTVDPLGYQKTSRYRKFQAEEDKLTKNTRWTAEQLKGMETSFLMSTILRISSLMKVGFGSAGVEIIRNNLAKGTRQNQSILSTKGTTVPCIFLFCDIRQFTDATESLQEEVFRFTNRIAMVVHSYCHAYGGAANKNVGDAFLLSWSLDEVSSKSKNDDNYYIRTNTSQFSSNNSSNQSNNFMAKNYQADKALWTVVKITIALQYDEFYLTMSEEAKQRLLDKLSSRKGPVVQMGCGLHAGTAVQGAIGSERKIDATYVSEAVEMAEYLESSTKKYGVKVLMSNQFHSLLDTNNRRRCRKVDQIIVLEDDRDDLDEDEILDQGEILELFTFDMDLDALQMKKTTDVGAGGGGVGVGAAATTTAGADNNGSDIPESNLASKRDVMARAQQNFQSSRRHGIMSGGESGRRYSRSKISEKDVVANAAAVDFSSSGGVGGVGGGSGAPVGVPTGAAAMDRSSTHAAGVGVGVGGAGGVVGAAAGVAGAGVGGGGDGPGGGGVASGGGGGGPSISNIISGATYYNPSVWKNDDDFQNIRRKYISTRFPFLQKFNSGLQLFYAREWKEAKQNFQDILEQFEDDGPSRYFMNQIEKNNGRPPPGFIGFGRA